ncbi:MAG: hypothetical protein Q8Q23_03115 [bacterium]|nr:hypothetical protein [bacterium]
MDIQQDNDNRFTLDSDTERTQSSWMADVYTRVRSIVKKMAVLSVLEKVLVLIMVVLIAAGVGFYYYHRKVVSNLIMISDEITLMEDDIIHFDVDFDDPDYIIEPSIEELEWAAEQQEIALNEAGYLADTTNWNSYQSEQYGFGFKYPSGWIVIDRDLINQLVVVKSRKDYARESRSTEGADLYVSFGRSHNYDDEADFSQRDLEQKYGRRVRNDNFPYESFLYEIGFGRFAVSVGGRLAVESRYQTPWVSPQSTRHDYFVDNGQEQPLVISYTAAGKGYENEDYIIALAGIVNSFYFKQ